MQDALGRRRGVTGVWVAITLPVLVGMAAMAVDVGYICTRANELQNAADAGALAGASGLPDSNGVARARAMEYGGKNPLGNEFVVINGDDVQIGNWEWMSQTFTPISDTDDSGFRPNAVRAIGRKERLPLFFAAIWGFDDTNLLRDAIALADGGRCRGIWGLEGVIGAGGIITDSYDSRKGPYAAGNINQNGDVCSNQDVSLGGSSLDIRGDVGYGPGYDITYHGNPEV